MNNAVFQVDVSSEALPTESDDLRNRPDAGVHPVCIEDLAHELRQPLSTIDSLAYFLEMTAADERVCIHLRQIRRMVNRASRILDHAAA
jgi:signal transduction histidine kinase